jgi:large subunit ribosomal protein L9
MEVILIQDVDSLGMAGQTVNVARGFARNKLIPSQLAVEATPGNLKKLEKQRAEFEIRSKKEKERAQELADRIEALTITISQKAGEKDKLYGSVTSMDLAAAMEDKGVEIDRRKIKLPDPIKSLGDHEVPIRLHQDVTAMLRVSVVREES